MIIWRCLYHLAFCFNIWQLQSSFISFLDERLDWLYQKLLSLNKSFRKLFNWTKKNCYQLKLMKMNRTVYECNDNMCEFSFKKKFQFYIYIESFHPITLYLTYFCQDPISEFRAAYTRFFWYTKHSSMLNLRITCLWVKHMKCRIRCDFCYDLEGHVYRAQISLGSPWPARIVISMREWEVCKMFESKYKQTL